MSIPVKNQLVKALRLQKYFLAYQAGGNQKAQVIEKFTQVWGQRLAEHFLWKYDDAESLIWALDSENLQLYLDKF